MTEAELAQVEQELARRTHQAPLPGDYLAVVRLAQRLAAEVRRVQGVMREVRDIYDGGGTS